MHITLMRHGKPDLTAWPWIKASNMAEWIAAYNQAGINIGLPPAHARTAAAKASVIVSSDLNRSIESANCLRPDLPLVSDALFREAALPCWPVYRLKLPPRIWAACFRILWLAGYSDHSEARNTFQQRVTHATTKLQKLAEQHGSVLFVGHGILNQFISKQLLADGWTSSAGHLRHYWDAVDFSQPHKK